MKITRSQSLMARVPPVQLIVAALAVEIISRGRQFFEFPDVTGEARFHRSLSREGWNGRGRNCR